MALAITHPKVNTVADWTQADLDEQIALGNFAPGTLLADIPLPSDWNDDHSISGTLAASSIDSTPSTFAPETTAQAFIDSVARGVRGFGIVNMANADYVMTADEAALGAIAVFNSGDGTKTLTYPATSDGTVPNTVMIITAFSGNVFYVASESWGIPKLMSAPEVDIILYGYGVGVSSFYGSNIHDSIADGGLYAPTQNAVYDAINGALNTSSAGIAVKTTITESSAATDAGKRVYCSNAAAVTYTIEPSATADLGNNGTFRLQAGAGGITIAAGAGVTLVGSTTVAAYDCITCDRDGVTETWYL